MKFRKKESQTERKRDREEKQKERERQKERQTERQRKRDRESSFIGWQTLKENQEKPKQGGLRTKEKKKGN